MQGNSSSGHAIAHQDERRITIVYLPSYRRIVECTNISIPKAMAFWLGPVLAYRLTPLGVFYLYERWHFIATPIANFIWLNR